MAQNKKVELNEVAERSLERFRKEERLLSFQQYLEKLESAPHLLARNSTQYLADAIRHYGSEEIERPFGKQRRYRVFDGEYERHGERLVGNEVAQQAFMRLLDNFRREGRVNRLVVIHGPNGSAKTSFVAALFRALEAYSRTDEGAIYRFNWVFPVNESAGGPIGFGGYNTQQETVDTYAFLEDDHIDAKLPSEHNDNPLFLLPREERQEFFAKLREEFPEFHLSRTIREGGLGHRSRKVFDALMTAYRGDVERVLKHVQVERMFISRRYRRAAVTVEPQLRIDAGVRQLTVDRSLNALPKVLQSQTLFEVSGPLVEGNRGLIEFNDFLKRPMEANKYLLATGEKGTVALENRVIHLDSVLIGTANETYLEGLKQQPDWSSYRGRLELIRMGYLLDYRDEAGIYEDLLDSIEIRKPVAPRTTEMLGLWAVMTRLQKPNPDLYESELENVIQRLTPLQKALLYADGTLPEQLNPDEKQLLKAAIPDLHRHGSEAAYYEGRVGASPRELKRVLLDDVHSESKTLSPFGLLKRLKRLTKDTSMFEWLRIEPVGEYHRPARFLKDVREHYLDICERDVRVATGLVEEGAHLSLFERYIRHANAFLKNEQLRDPVTDTFVEPDVGFMEDVEERMSVKEKGEVFRSDVVSRVAAFRIENPAQQVDFERIFPDLLAELENAYFRTKQVEIEKIWDGLLAFYDGETDDMDAEQLRTVEATHQRLADRYGYTRQTAREVVAVLRSDRRRTEQ
jgi:predicted Ser/Thr protein kinase